MPSSTVSLGGVTLLGHEVPAYIPFGGRQKLVKHKLIGGRRVTDSMGPDDCDLKWEGRFRGQRALSRAKSIDAMRKRGAQVPLSWGGLYYLVIIEEFDAEYRRSTDIPYRIVCYAVEDSGGGSEAAVGLDALVGADMGTVLGLAGTAVPGPLSGAVADLSALIGGVSSLVAAPLGAIPPIQAAASRAVGVVDAEILASDATITAAGVPDPALLAGPAFAATLLAQAAALDGQDALLRAKGLLGRTALNLNSIAG